MSQLFARVFTQILDSSIAEDFTTRHVFEDFFKLAEHRTGIVDMTRHAISRRLNIPLETLNACIEKLESPDPSSRDSENEGRRIERLDEHRDWGWKIINWEKYEQIRDRTGATLRVTRHRDRLLAHPRFEEASKIYEEYPLKVGKPQAISAIIKALEKESFEHLLQRTKDYAAARMSEDPNYTPHPSTWFNQQRYNDDPKTWRKSNLKAPVTNSRNAGVVSGKSAYATATPRLQRSRT